jgi:hypothetical protein
VKIIPLRGLNIRGIGHAPSGVPVEVDEALAKELLILGVARKAPPPVAAPAAPPAPVVETAAAPAAPETAEATTARKPRRAG